MRLRHSPPMMRTLFFISQRECRELEELFEAGNARQLKPLLIISVLGSDHDNYHPVRIDAALKGILDLGNSYSVPLPSRNHPDRSEGDYKNRSWPDNR